MKTLLTCATMLLLSVALVGCENKSSVKKETTVKTPEGSSTKTTETTIEAKGKNPPSTDSPQVPAPNP